MLACDTPPRRINNDSCFFYPVLIEVEGGDLVIDGLVIGFGIPIGLL